MQQLQNASDPSVCAGHVLDTLLEVLVAIREKTARRHGGGPSLVHMRAMGVLRKRPGATLSMVADQLALTLSATSRLVDCLVHKGLVTRHVPEGNRRTVSLMLTRTGSRMLDSVIRETQQELAQPLKYLNTSQRRALCESMTLLRHVIAEDAVSSKKKKSRRMADKSATS